MEPHNIQELRARIGDRVVVASVSGGKDSTAMALYLQELGIPYRAVFMDTGWEHAEVYEYIRDVLPEYIGPVETIRAEVPVPTGLEREVADFEARLGRPSPMVRLVLTKAMFSNRKHRWCTEKLKMLPARDYLASMDDDPISASGIRAAESTARAKYPEWEWWDSADCEQWRPILTWTDDDLVDIHTRHSVPPNPLYLRGAHRVGCWPCIYARKSEVRNIADTDPDRIQIVAELEALVTKLSRAKIEARGETPKYDWAGWFSNPTARKNPVTGKWDGQPWPIERVVEWARTRRGGRQYEMFAPPAREWGCMRWGVCDTGAGGED